ncbi:OmpH family outer membrane protein [Sporobolomyces salmoneus]|uniref:OmpH family outer membrane protein n=1 Tax=Sporobolomyces salmoneus TaxID=183962 RepID=UPI00317C3AD0
MQPTPQHARPRPPSNRAPSSRLTALPTPLSPRRQRPSAFSNSDHHLASSPSSMNLPSPIWSSSIPPDTPPLGLDDMNGVLGHPGREKGEGKDEREEVKKGRRTSSIPFPTAAITIEQPQSTMADREGDESSGSATPKTHSRLSGQFDCLLDDGTPTKRQEVTKNSSVELVKDPKLLGQMSREELEKMLSDADRIIREKEQELSVFTSAGEGLLQEYHSLRNRHESLLARQRSTSGQQNVSPLRPSRLVSGSLSPSRTRVPSDSQHNWKNSLGPSSIPTGQGRRISSGGSRIGGITSSTSYVFATSSSSTSLSSNARTTPPTTVRIDTTGSSSPSTSPTGLRNSHRFTSSASVASLFAPPVRTTLMSPKSPGGGQVDPQEVEHLSHLNYSLTQRVEELEMESEFAEREGRKKLRRLEKELLALKEDLERSEGRNQALESEREKGLEKKGKAESSDREKEWNDDNDPEECADEGNETFTSNSANLDKAGESERSTENSTSPAPSPSRFLAAPHLTHFRSPGNGITRVRAVSSTSSLASLPRIPLFDPSLLDAQQDELFNQLIAKIDELQDANEAILEEREEMEEKLEIAREEVREWMGKCEDLEELQQRIEWEGTDRKAIGWLDDGTSDSPSRRSHLSESHEGSPTPPSSALGRSLRNELSGLWSQDSSISQQPDTIEVTDDEEEEAVDSIVVHTSHSEPVVSNLNVARIRRRNPRRTITPISFNSQRSKSTADDLVPAGTLGSTKIESYEDFANEADKLEPVWADEFESTRTRLEGINKPKLLEAVAQEEAGDPRQLRSKKERKTRKTSKKNKNRVLSSIRFGSDEEEDDDSTPIARRTLALRRLGLEASSRHTSQIFPRASPNEDDNDDASSVVSSNYDLIDRRDQLDSNDYYPVTLRARYHPRMLSNMMKDSAIRHVVTLITWVRFLIILAMAISFAVWQGPRKTLGLVDGRRRLR